MMTNVKGSAAPTSVLWLFLALGGLVFVSEALIMMLLTVLRPLSWWGEMLFDSTLLLVPMFSTLYIFIFRPLTASLSAHEQAEREIQEDSQMQSALNRLVSLSLQDLTLEQTLEQAIDQVTSLPWFSLESKGAILLMDDKQDMLVMAAQRGLAAPLLTTCARVALGTCICGRTALRREVVFVDSIDEHHENTFEGIRPHGHYSVPIFSEGRLLGVLNTYVEAGHPYNYKEEEFLCGAAAAIAGIVERKRAGDRQARLVAQLSEINQELKDFAYVVSHDLKAPLRAIRTLADWLMSDYQDRLDPQGKENLQLMSNRVDRMYNLIDGVLQYSRVGRTEQGITPVDLGRIVPEIIDDLGVPPHLSVDIEGDLPVVAGDPTRITQIFQNLLSNAIKYMDKPVGRIGVGCVKEDSFWRFHVSDNGPGIEEKHFDRIFKLFQTLAPRDGNESTGIGLTIARKIVEMYGGRIWLESQVGSGCTFFFTLPPAVPDASRADLEKLVAV
jgi:signal transduction histidine kinase